MKYGKNLFEGIPQSFEEEIVEPLLRETFFTVERIISCGQATPPGKWYDQQTHEWVLLLQGRAGLRFEEQGDREVIMEAGDYLLIPAHTRHRVEWTAPDETTVWLALHYSPTSSSSQSL